MEGSKLGDPWKVPSFMGLGRFQTWWPLECSMFGCFWKEKENEKKKHPFHLFPLFTTEDFI